MLGAVAQFGVIDSAYSAKVPDEQRFEVIVGYSTKLPDTKINPYLFLSRGLRKFSDDRESVDYHTMTLGGTYLVTERIYLDGYYKYRNTNDIDWKAHLVSTGIGFIWSSNLSVQLNLGRTRGDYTSRFFNIAFNRRF